MQIKRFCLAIIFALSTFIVFTSKATTLVTTTNNVPVQKETTDLKVIDLIENGVELESDSQSGNFYKIKYNNIEGYVQKNYVKNLNNSINDEISGDAELNVYLIPVIGSDSFLITYKSNKNDSEFEKVILIDTGANEIKKGRNNGGLMTYNFLKNMGIKKIDYLIGTHMHFDHVEGWKTLAQKGMQIDNVLVSEYAKWSANYRKYVVNVFKNKDTKITEVSAGYTLNIGEVTLKVLSPHSGLTKPKELKNYMVNEISLIIRISIGNRAFLFTGDAFLDHSGRTKNPQKFKLDEWMLNTYSAEELSSDVLKMPHHGLNSFDSKLLELIFGNKTETYAISTSGKTQAQYIDKIIKNPYIANTSILWMTSIKDLVKYKPNTVILIPARENGAYFSTNGDYLTLNRK